MKKIILLVILSGTLFSFEGTAIKVIGKYFSTEVIEVVSKQYGKNGISVLEKLSSKYGKNALGIMEEYAVKYGDDGLKLLVKYGETALRNKTTFELVKRFGDKGFYLVKQFPKKSTAYFEKYGDVFVTTANRMGNSRTIGYMNEASKYGADGKVLHFLNKFGQKGSIFLEKHWGKLLVSSFMLLNADSLIDSVENISKRTIDKGADVVEHTVKNVADSQLGWMIGLALLLFVFFKYGLDNLIKTWQTYKRKNKS